MRCQVRVFEVFKGGTGDNDIELFLTRYLRKAMCICNDIDISTTFDISAKVFASVGNPFFMTS